MPDNNSQSIEFSTQDTAQSPLTDEMAALATLIAALNRAGVPWTLRKDHVAIALTITAGY